MAEVESTAQGESCKFGIIGDTFIDVLVYGVGRNLPNTWGSDTRVSSVCLSLGGSALNVAHVLATTLKAKVLFCSAGTFSLGIRVPLSDFSLVGNDTMAKYFLQNRSKTIEYAVKQTDGPTATCVALNGIENRYTKIFFLPRNIFRKAVRTRACPFSKHLLKPSKSSFSL
jgi:hypothetical protein